MSQHDYAPSVPPELLEAWRQMMAAPPEWSVGEQAYQPYDIGSAQTGLNFQQDQMNSMRDPFTAYLAGPGAYDPNTFGYDYEVTQPGTTDGLDFLNSIVSKSPSSAQAIIGQALLEGQSPQDALKFAQTTLGNEALLGADGQIDKAYTDFANNSFQKLHSDKKEIGQDKPNKALQSFLDAGLGDPNQQFTPQLMDQNYDAYTPGTAAAKRVVDAPSTKSMRPGARAPQQADVDATSAMKQMLGIGPAMSRDARNTGVPGAALVQPKGAVALDPNSQLAARKDYMRIRDASGVNEIRARRGAESAVAAYGTPTMMAMAQRLGMVR